MKRLFSTILAGAALAVTAGAANAAILDIQMTVTPVNTPNTGLYNVLISAKSTGGATGQGDGGISDLQFAITSNGHGLSNAVAAGVGPLSSKGKITWDDTVNSNFSTVNPTKSDVGGDGDADMSGAAFFDSNNFKKDDLGVSGYAPIATVQFQLTPAGLISGDTLHLTPSNVQYYDFTNGTSPNFRGTYSSITAADVVLPAVPEPASIGLLGLGAVGLVARRRRA